MRFALAFLVVFVVAGCLTAETGKKCRPGDYHCGDGRCVPQSFVCDGVFDCGDGIDEKNCKVAPAAPKPAIGVIRNVPHDPTADMPVGEADAPTFPLEFGR